MCIKTCSVNSASSTAASAFVISSINSLKRSADAGFIFFAVCMSLPETIDA